ncbi:MAG: T9SS type A sorting domain-containing protein [Bacteroidaceae bacterium]|nr:T9SS type A sorting domain-containing protein [Bacteroidaceae bacterium]
MKRFLTIFSLFLCVAASLAQNTLNVHQKDGTVVKYGFSEKPTVTYTDAGIHLATTKVEVDYPFANLEMFTFSDESSAIDVLTTERTSDDVRIYNTNGVLLKTVKQSDGAASFSTSDLPKGIYIIKNGKTTYKITKR